MYLLYVDGVPVEVMDYQWSKEDIDIDSGRTLSGYMDRNVCDHRPRTLKVIFPPQDQPARQALLNTIDKDYLTISLFDPKTGGYSNYTMMHGTLPSKIKYAYSLTEILYEAMAVDFVEY